jgi:uncharacterized membrane protein
MNKSTIKCIIIVIGTLFSFLLTRFLDIDHPIGRYFTGWILTYSIVGTCAFLFGSIVGCAIGIFGTIIISILRIIQYFSVLKYFPLGIIHWELLYILLNGFYGFILGKIFEIKKVKEKIMIQKYIIFTFSSIIMSFIVHLCYCVIFCFRFFFRLGLISSIESIILSSLSVGIIGLIISIIYHKVFKGNIPYFRNIEKV